MGNVLTLESTHRVVLTKNLRNIIKDAITQTGSKNTKILCGKVCEILENKFKGETLDYHLKQMNIENTSHVIEAIESYLIDFEDKANYRKVSSFIFF